MIVLGIGSSIEPREEYLRRAIDLLSKNKEITVKKISKVYKTLAWGGVAQNYFLNICVSITFSGEADTLLDIIQDIENHLGRVRDKHWGDRTIDIDILFFNNSTINNDRLIVPHPYILQRNFVLAPLIDVCGDISFEGRKLSDWLSDISDSIEICGNVL
ncbi:2-amino-4-hydroxy-6-hydroxymethyldihydropteridine diphosphokinase [Gemella sp. GH3]|uniref:2-amino-4-hydroxy-6- hydroxymethyldihydropteridine diphosphokinase n=1 Tax=unclassified Gemella TaxID=2624949 RepID=UPI0015CF9F62|nr:MULTISPECIES: 2-amino-4-hydroxy-6-hydroxymethyldihydropteridine diphosphokinase [unclassified Gemella]MBF0713555.1 2-amino-4-hydroxy-6-hydroxymethyldihydropteridine diphosphokinase [Gemella sp. GH3.1]NYS50507.1 2-amino-4-hydroxy-6-hydroxymethyldihydropteridine diphosphokinase [Gemella sp. GH3]